MKLFRQQKAIIRKISSSKKDAHTAPIFKKLGILSLDDLNRQEMCKFIHNDVFFLHRFDIGTRSAVHSYQTRHHSDLALPRYLTHRAQKSVFYSGVKLFNDLPLNLKSTTDKNSFKINLKRRILLEQIS